MSTAILPTITLSKIDEEPSSLIQTIIDGDHDYKFYARNKGAGPHEFALISPSLSLERIISNLTKADDEEGHVKRVKNKRPERVQWTEIAATIQATWGIPLTSRKDPSITETLMIEAEGGFVFWLAKEETARLDSSKGSVLLSVAWTRLSLPRIPGRELPKCPKSDFGFELYFNPQKGTMGRYVYDR